MARRTERGMLTPLSLGKVLTSALRDSTGTPPKSMTRVRIEVTPHLARRDEMAGRSSGVWEQRARKRGRIVQVPREDDIVRWPVVSLALGV